MWAMRAAEKHTASDAIVAAFADALLGTQMAHPFEEMPGHPRTCWACGSPRRDHGPESREVVTLDLADLTTASPVDGPARCERKRAPR